MPKADLIARLHRIDSVCLTNPCTLTTAPHGFSLHPDKMVAPLLCPLPDGSGLLLEDWTYALTQTFLVPAAVMADVRLALELR